MTVAPPLPVATRVRHNGEVRLADRVLVHQVHPAKLGADVAASVLSNALLWRGRPRAAAVVRVVLPVAGSAAVLGLADLEALARTRRGRYVLEHMPPYAQAVRLAGDAVMVVGARRRSPGLLAVGALVVAAGWSHGLWTRSPSPADLGPDLASDEELGKHVVGELTPHNAPINLADYDPEWPRQFSRDAERVRAALGEAALRVEHVGSTSVPGLAAKPIIDILLVVADSADEPAYVPVLQSAGYVLRIREPEWFEHRLFKGPETNINMHVFSDGAAEIERMLLFRDWLRRTDADRREYERVKRDLAQRTWRHVQHYADAKTVVVQEIMARAYAAGSPSTSQD